MNSLLERADKFVNRHIGPDVAEQEAMLRALGVDSLDQLISETIPANIRLKQPLNIPAAKSEFALLNYARTIAAQNTLNRSYIGMGYYDTITPPVILRNVMENPGWYTQYTPYQAEIAQGRLEALLNFQTLVIDLTGMEIANASLLDEGTAAAEAMNLMFAARSKELERNEANVFFVSDTCLPQTVDILKTRSAPLGINLVVGNHREIETSEWNSKIFGVLVQYPAGDGAIYDYSLLCEKVHANGALVAVAADLMSLLLLTPPGEFGADIVLGSAQRFGVPLGYGGPHAAFFATKDEYKRLMPGRIIGVSVDAHGNTAYRMALQTREQHIRRDKATSNICTAQVLLAVMASMYAVYHGPKGLRAIASRINGLAQVLHRGLSQIGVDVLYSQYFDTLRVACSNADAVRTEALAAGINFRYFDNGDIGVSLDEVATLDDVRAMIEVFIRAMGSGDRHVDVFALQHDIELNAPSALRRTSDYLAHAVFNKHHSESEMLRYMKSLENKDLSLVHSMIPLGSCTMKLNATSEMIPVTWPEFGAIHPFAPVDQTRGYQVIFEELRNALCEITGFDAFSLQPNSGAQGEYAGLMVIRDYHISRGDGHRNVVVIPASAHGTNPASAVMAGMKVVVVKTDEQGNIDFADLKAKVEQNSANLSALMVTYPSTHGVFEEHIADICKLIHEHGGRVYMDGANMNAQVGLTSPRAIGADVCHINLHKTFCIPHGGGGPGMGPIGVVADLAPFLPGHVVVPVDNRDHAAVSAAPWGSASILLISWAYIRMMGGEGLTEATKLAILNANYIKSRLEQHFPILYKGTHGRAAHEMIVDMRRYKQTAGVEVEDIAKRLMDYGFHAPTVSFPVPGTLMIEPTESENLEELDRFCDALISIGAEIAEIENGTADRQDNVLKNAPHTAMTVTADVWSHPYPREKAAYPAPWLRHAKFWPSVGRVNNTYGDRTLICSCPSPEEYIEGSELQAEAEATA